MAYFNEGNFMPIDFPVNLHIIWDIFCGILSFTLFVPLFVRFANNKILMLNEWGRETLGVYVIHIAIYTLFIRLFNTLYMEINGMYYAISVIMLTSFVFCLSLFLCKRIESVYWGAKLLLGK